MDGEFQTSFIPKKPLAEARVEEPHSVSVFMFLATILFIASLIAAGGVFLWNATLVKSRSDKADQLDKAKNAFEGDFITTLSTASNRISAARDVIANHITVTPIFQALQASTLKSIQFTKFTHTVVGSGTNAMIQVQMSGKATGYTAIALESDALTENKYIQDPVFSNLTLDDQSNVLFDLTFSVDPRLLIYTDVLDKKNQSAATSVPVTPTPNTPTQ